ncbi:hypothetical protein Tco_0426051 [Tanacetum coccineum]
MESQNSNSQERELHPLQQMQDKAKESCIVSFRLLHLYLTALSNNDLKGTSIEGGFEREFATLFEQDVQTFTRTIQKREMYSSKALDAGLVVTESNETESERHVLSSRSGKDTHTDDADINSMNDKQPMAEVQLTAEHNILANEQQHYEQSESIYDTYLLEKGLQHFEISIFINTPPTLSFCSEVDSWKDSSKNLWKLVDSGMSSTSKVGLGYEIKSNDEVLSYEEEMNHTVFNCTEEDFIDKPLYGRFSKTDSFKGVPHPLTRDYTPKPQQEIDESLYVYGKKGPQKPKTSV